MLFFRYTHQKMCVRWAIQLHKNFLLEMVLIKQGGIMSPILFNMYMDNLSIHLNSSRIEGFINHLFYADNLCLISLPSSEMRQLLHICNAYAPVHQLIYN